MRRQSVLLAAFVVGVAFVRLLSQTQVDQTAPKFEVASIKPTRLTPGLMGVQFLPGGRVVVAQSPLQLLIAAAYGIPEERIEWSQPAPPVFNELYNVEAKAPSRASLQGVPDRLARRQLALMLQSLLADRFQLRLHRETKVFPVFLLTVAKNGPRLVTAPARDCSEAPSTPTPCHVFHGGPARGVSGKTVNITDLADYLTFVGRPVVDRTGIGGDFDIELPAWSRGTELATRAADDGHEPTPDPSSPTIFAILADLGLKLESAKEPLDVLLIDHVQRPTPD
jgi:uncharacterized protein (TIGR03435 family)